MPRSSTRRKIPTCNSKASRDSSSKGAAAIIVTGLGGESIGPVAEEATSKGIFVVQVAGRDLAESGAVTVSVEEADIANAEGTAAGQYAAEVYGDEPIEVVITDYPSIESLVARADMIEESFLAEYPAADVRARGSSVAPPRTA